MRRLMKQKKKKKKIVFHFCFNKKLNKKKERRKKKTQNSFKFLKKCGANKILKNFQFEFFKKFILLILIYIYF